MYNVPTQHTVTGHYRPASETPLEWRFAGGRIVARFYPLTGYLLPYLLYASKFPSFRHPGFRRAGEREGLFIFRKLWNTGILVIFFWGAVSYFWRFRELRKVNSGIWEDQVIILRDQGSADPRLGLIINLFKPNKISFYLGQSIPVLIRVGGLNISHFIQI